MQVIFLTRKHRGFLPPPVLRGLGLLEAAVLEGKAPKRGHTDTFREQVPGEPAREPPSRRAGQRKNLGALIRLKAGEAARSRWGRPRLGEEELPRAGVQEAGPKATAAAARGAGTPASEAGQRPGERLRGAPERVPATGFAAWGRLRARPLAVTALFCKNVNLVKKDAPPLPNNTRSNRMLSNVFSKKHFTEKYFFKSKRF